MNNIDITPLKGTDKPVPYDMITDELRIFCSNLKSCKKNVANGNYKYFTMKEHQYGKKSRSVLLPKKAITKKGILTNNLGKLTNFNNSIMDLLDNNLIESDCRLIYDYKIEKVYIQIPINRTKQNFLNKEKFIALDPGEKIFQTFYGEKTCGTFGDNNRLSTEKIDSKIKRYKNILLNNRNRKGEPIKNKKRLKIRIQKLRNKKRNKIIDFQNNVANYICKNYERILLPTFNTQNMVREEGPLSSEVKRNLMRLSHYRFKQHITHKSEEYGCKIDIVGEEYTSKCCGKCGKLSDNFTNREKKCNHCGARIDRDMNGAYNIFLKNMEYIIV